MSSEDIAEPLEALECYCSGVNRFNRGDPVINSSGGVQLLRLNSARLPHAQVGRIPRSLLYYSNATNATGVYCNRLP
jgi:hypothetical protein